MARLVDEIASRYSDRIVIFDSPPLLATTESRVLASLMGQLVVVVEAAVVPSDNCALRAVRERHPSSSTSDRQSAATNAVTRSTSLDFSRNMAPSIELGCLTSVERNVEKILPIKITSLSSGEFVGIVADNPDQKIALKAFIVHYKTIM